MKVYTMSTARRKAGITQSEMAKKLSTTSRTLRKVETGESDCNADEFRIVYSVATGIGTSAIVLPSEYGARKGDTYDPNTARIMSGMTQTEVADAMGLSKSAISQMERGIIKTSEKTREELAKLYGLPVSHIEFYN